MMDAAADIDGTTIDALVAGRHGDPFGWLGPHRRGGGMVVRTLQPGALSVEAVSRDGGDVLGALELLHPGGLWGGGVFRPCPYLLRIVWPGGLQETEDPYAFGLLLGDLDLHLITQGTHYELGRCLGAQEMAVEGIPGVRFAVWAPNASRVSVIGDFNSWDGRRHPMRRRVEAGVFELFVPRLGAGARYKFELLDRAGRLLPQKADPVARAAEAAPGTASIVASAAPYRWTDEAWMAARGARQARDRPIAIYEVHTASWVREMSEGGRSLGWSELADRLIPYAAGLGFTHLELLPIMEYPFGGSWGYQPLGLFAPTGRHGPADAFAHFVDRCHAAGLGVILDWVPAHFPTDPHGLARFDGTALYEHEDPREGFHQDWNTLIYNLGRNEVRGFLLASAFEWLERYHIDGLRVDAVASMLYRDYSRAADAWIPNRHGGRENLEAIEFFRHLNSMVPRRAPGAITIAEESTAWPGVTAPAEAGGLGFSYKWNMGWMHDTLAYIGEDPVHRRWHHDRMTFGLVYAFAEAFVLPLSHDEVVHGKGSLVDKAPGDDWQRRATLRAYLAFMWAHPGKKLLFMGGEIGQEREWNHDASVDWDLLDDPAHAGIRALVGDLNRVYRDDPALHALDADPRGFEWLVADDRENAVLAFLRRGGDGPPVLVVANFTPVPRRGYRIGVPISGRWREFLNSDAAVYGGGNIGNGGGVQTRPVAAHGCAQAIDLELPPLATIFLKAEFSGAEAS